MLVFGRNSKVYKKKIILNEFFEHVKKWAFCRLSWQTQQARLRQSVDYNLLSAYYVSGTMQCRHQTL